MTREYKLFIHDILDSINKADAFIGSMAYSDFLLDEKTKSAVVWQVQIIGEATKNIPKKIKDKYKEVPWSAMAKIRDKITHFYFGIKYEILWKVIKEELPPIKLKIEQILNDLESEGDNVG
jgi:uncharacterized protein with HEPN domain